MKAMPTVGIWPSSTPHSSEAKRSIGVSVQTARDDRWDALARGALRDDLYSVLESLSRSVLEANAAAPVETTPAELFEVWSVANKESIQRSKTSLAGIRRLENPNIAALSVALRSLRSVIRSGS